MQLHEYQAKSLLAGAGLAVPRGRVCVTVEEAEQAGVGFGWPVAVKAQVLAGGRGKGGGVRIVADPEELRQAAGSILGMRLVTAQTGEQGLRVGRILVEEALDIDRELYLSLLPDRETATLAVVVSAEGGVNIEETAAAAPEKILRLAVDPLLGVQPFHLRRLSYFLGLDGETGSAFSRFVSGLAELAVRYDLLLAEINPLVVTGSGAIVALDAKVEVDSQALFRQPELAGQRDVTEQDPLERRAGEAGLNYIRLSGNIGTMVNGAGLAMATMDLIKRAGGSPANFLDVGGGASAAMIEQGFRILTADPDVKAILINIFGGILRCDVLASGVVEAAGSMELDLPVVVRMEGTNAEQGRELLAGSGLDLVPALSLADAAEKIATLARSL